MKRNQKTRTGAVLIMVLVCLGVATSILLSAMQSSLRQHRNVRHELQMEQTRWLLDAGISHGLVEVRLNPKYTGETLAPKKFKYPEATVDIRLVSESPPDTATTQSKTILKVTARIEHDQITTSKSREIGLD